MSEAEKGRGNKSDSIWLPLGIIDAGATLLFWGFSEFFGGHNAPALSNICFFLFVASVLAGLAGYLFKHCPNKRLICWMYVIACGLSAIVIYEFSRPLKAGSAGSNRPFTFSLLSSAKVEWPGTTDFLNLTNSILVDTTWGAVHPALGCVLIPIPKGQSTFVFRFVIRSSEFAERLEVWASASEGMGSCNRLRLGARS